MPVKYKFQVLPALRQKGYNTSRIRQEKLLNEATVQLLRHDKLVSWANIEKICRLLEIQPGELLEFVDEDTTGQQKDELPALPPTPEQRIEAAVASMNPHGKELVVELSEVLAASPAYRRKREPVEDNQQEGEEPTNV